MGVRRLPLTLEDALAALEQSTVIRGALGEAIVDPFLTQKAVYELLLAFQQAEVPVVLVMNRFDRFCETSSPQMVSSGENMLHLRALAGGRSDARDAAWAGHRNRRSTSPR